jgi:hypothetical protein
VTWSEREGSSCRCPEHSRGNRATQETKNKNLGEGNKTFGFLGEGTMVSPSSFIPGSLSSTM